MSITIAPMAEPYIGGYHDCLDSVARERRWIALYEAPPRESAEKYVRGMLADEAPFVVALDGSRVVGWCDIALNQRPVFRHVGVLGMGVHSDYRGQGVGTRLAKAALEQAPQRGLKRIELAVYAHNTAAIGLYRKLDFQVEGTKERAAKLDEGYVDLMIMARWLA